VIQRGQGIEAKSSSYKAKEVENGIWRSGGAIAFAQSCSLPGLLVIRISVAKSILVISRLFQEKEYQEPS
jgi:hypothetical protein